MNMNDKTNETYMSEADIDSLLNGIFGDDEVVETIDEPQVDAAILPEAEETVEPAEEVVEETDGDTEGVVVVERPAPGSVKLTGTRKPRVVVNKYAGMAPLSTAESDEFNSWLAAHGLCKTIGSAASTKRMRIYRNLGQRNGKQVHSRDCIYVVSADQWRKHKEGVYKVILKLSKKQMDEQNIVKVAEYREKMNQIEEDLLMQHHVVMNWYNGKSATFKKIQHVITAPDVLAMLDEAVKHNDKYDIKNAYLTRFRMGAQIEELGIAPQYNWRDFDVIVKSGKVVCAYSYRDLIPLHSETFKTGFFDKFGYNTEIVDSQTIADVVAKAQAAAPTIEV